MPILTPGAIPAILPPGWEQQADRRAEFLPSVKSSRCGRGPAGWQPGGSRFLIQVSEYLIDHRSVFAKSRCPEGMLGFVHDSNCSGYCTPSILAAIFVRLQESVISIRLETVGEERLRQFAVRVQKSRIGANVEVFPVRAHGKPRRIIRRILRRCRKVDTGHRTGRADAVIERQRARIRVTVQAKDCIRSEAACIDAGAVRCKGQID